MPISAGGERAPTEPASTAQRRREPEYRRRDPDEHGIERRARRDRRQRDEAREDAEDDAGDACGLRLAQALPHRIPVEPLRERVHARAPPHPQAPPAVPDVEDQDVGADEQHDQPLDHVREVAGELRLDHVRLQAVRRAEQERAEEQRGETGADGGVAPEQRDCDAEEADVRHRDVGHAEVVEVAEHVEAAGEPRERTRDRHRADEVLLHADAAVRSGLRVEADRAHLVAERRPVQQDPEDDERRERDEEADVEAL